MIDASDSLSGPTRYEVIASDPGFLDAWVFKLEGQERLGVAICDVNRSHARFLRFGQRVAFGREEPLPDYVTAAIEKSMLRFARSKSFDPTELVRTKQRLWCSGVFRSVFLDKTNEELRSIQIPVTVVGPESDQ